MTTASAKHYLLIFRSQDWYEGLSPAQIQEVADHWMVWFKGLTAEGKVIAGSPLEREGRVISGKCHPIISDGPFVEAKETIGGYFLLEVSSLEEAVTIAKECPGLPYGLRVEVRPIAEDCPTIGPGA